MRNLKTVHKIGLSSPYTTSQRHSTRLTTFLRLQTLPSSDSSASQFPIFPLLHGFSASTWPQWQSVTGLNPLSFLVHSHDSQSPQYANNMHISTSGLSTSHLSQNSRHHLYRTPDTPFLSLCFTHNDSSLCSFNMPSERAHPWLLYFLFLLLALLLWLLCPTSLVSYHLGLHSTVTSSETPSLTTCI